MTLSDVCEIKINFPEADFWLYTKGSEKSLGMPTKDAENYERKIGIKVRKDALDKLDPGYLYYVFMHLFSTQYWQKNGLVYGSTGLMNIRIQDVKNIRIG